MYFSDVYYGVYLIAALVWGIIWGIVTNKVISNKGYRENWFWWGFFFGWIALIVALTKPDKQPQEDNEMDSLKKIKEYKELLDSGIITQDEFDNKKKKLLSDGSGEEGKTWKCPQCGNVNPLSERLCEKCRHYLKTVDYYEILNGK